MAAPKGEPPGIPTPPLHFRQGDGPLLAVDQLPDGASPEGRTKCARADGVEVDPDGHEVT